MLVCLPQAQPRKYCFLFICHILRKIPIPHFTKQVTSHNRPINNICHVETVPLLSTPLHSTSRTLSPETKHAKTSQTYVLVLFPNLRKEITRQHLTHATIAKRGQCYYSGFGRFRTLHGRQSFRFALEYCCGMGSRPDDIQECVRFDCWLDSRSSAISCRRWNWHPSALRKTGSRPVGIQKDRR